MLCSLGGFTEEVELKLRAQVHCSECPCGPCVDLHGGKWNCGFDETPLTFPFASTAALFASSLANLCFVMH